MSPQAAIAFLSPRHQIPVDIRAGSVVPQVFAICQESNVEPPQARSLMLVLCVHLKDVNKVLYASSLTDDGISVQIVNVDG